MDYIFEQEFKSKLLQLSIRLDAIQAKTIGKQFFVCFAFNILYNIFEKSRKKVTINF